VATAKRFLEEGSRIVLLDRYEPAVEEIKIEFPKLEDTCMVQIYFRDQKS
jgi:NADP-dependent 3-hydroxy acid dehydrogenase YdfG